MTPLEAVARAIAKSNHQPDDASFEPFLPDALAAIQALIDNVSGDVVEAGAGVVGYYYPKMKVIEAFKAMLTASLNEGE